jgi:hypothetical protein
MDNRIIDEYKRRIKTRTAVTGIRAEAELLLQWYQSKYPHARRPAIGTITKKIAPDHRAANLASDQVRARAKSRARSALPASLKKRST